MNQEARSVNRRWRVTNGISSVSRWVDLGVRTVAPIVLAFLVGGVIVASLGANPLSFYGDIVRLGLAGQGWQQSLTAMAPLLLVALGLIVAFRAQLWNLASPGIYLFTAAIVAGIAPGLLATLPFAAGVSVVILVALAVGAALALVPAWLKTSRGVNEVVTSLMLSFVALGGANLLVRGPFQDPEVSLPQTQVLDTSLMLPFLPGTRVHVGVAVALVVVLVFHVVLTRTAFGLRVDMLGANPAAAAHAGVHTKRLTLAVFAISGALIALAAVLDMLGLWGYMRPNWNPGYGDKILPFVFLARLSPLGSIPLVGFYAVFATGGTLAAQRAGLSVEVLNVHIALVLFFMVLIEACGHRLPLGRSYLRRGLFGRGLFGRAPGSGEARAETIAQKVGAR